MLSCMAAELNDNALMLRYRDGDMAAFETLYEKHKGPLFRFLLRHTDNQQFAEDVFQEVWAKIIKSRNNYRSAAKFTTYMYRIARNSTIDHYRRSGRQPALLQEHNEHATELAAPGDDPVTAAEHRDLQRSLTTALNSLPEEQREVFLLREESGFTLAEISEITATGTETVKSRLRYALAKIRRCIPPADMQGVDDD